MHTLPHMHQINSVSCTPLPRYQTFATVRKAEYAVSARIFVNESIKYIIQVK
jgi:hypothetical protein